MKIIFMGTPEFALLSLKALDKSFNVELVVTQPDKPVGRKKEILLSPVKKYCVEKGLKYLQPEKLKNNTDFIENIKEISPDLICVAAYGKILNNEILNIPKIGCINIHASLLPKFRGAAPINRAIINGEKETGITLMKMDIGMDTGDIISQSKIQIHNEDTTLTLTNKLAEIGANEIVKLVNRFRDGLNVAYNKQNNDEATMAPKMCKEDGRINWKSKFSRISSLIRGCNPWPIAHTTLEGTMIKVYKIKPHNSEKILEGNIKKINGSMVVGCNDLNIEILEIQKSGQKKISGIDFINGISKIENPHFT